MTAIIIIFPIILIILFIIIFFLSPADDKDSPVCMSTGAVLSTP